MGHITTYGYGDSALFKGISITPAANQITIRMSQGFTISGNAANPAKYIIERVGSGLDVTVTNVAQVGLNLVLSTSNQTGACAYILHMPTSGYAGVSSDPYAGAFDWNFNGVVTDVAVLILRAVNARTLDVIFQGDPDLVQAVIASNYTIPGLTVSKAEFVTQRQYRLTTSKQVPGQLYTLTTQNI